MCDLVIENINKTNSYTFSNSHEFKDLFGTSKRTLTFYDRFMPVFTFLFI